MLPSLRPLGQVAGIQHQPGFRAICSGSKALWAVRMTAASVSSSSWSVRGTQGERRPSKGMESKRDHRR